MCEFSGTYDSAKYTEAQLRDTAKLFFGGDLSLEFFTVWKYEDVAMIDLAAVDSDYKQKLKALRSLNLVKHPYWEEARNSRIRELEQRYRLTRATLEGYTDPSALLRYPGAEECKAKYAEPLAAGGAKLLETWRTLNVEGRKNNADPDRLRRKFEAEYASADRMKFALMEVMAFGWNNCAIRTIYWDEGHSNGNYQEEFEKLFKHVKTLYCEEP